MIIIVTGGRNFNDVDLLNRALDLVHQRFTISLLVQGGCRGADTLAKQWAKSRGVPQKQEDADWDRYKTNAGPIRNAKMLQYNPSLVVAFPGDRGTADMVRKSKAAGVKVLMINHQ